MAEAAAIVGAISGAGQLIGNIAGKNEASARKAKGDAAFDPMKGLADRLAGGKGAYTPNIEGLAGQIGLNQYGGMQRQALEGLGSNPFAGQIQDLLAQGQRSQYGGEVSNIAQQLQNLGQGQDAQAMRSTLGGLGSNPYARQLEGLAEQLSSPTDNSSLQGATDYQFRQLQKRLTAAGASRGAVGSSMLGQDLARGGAELYGNAAQAIANNQMQRNQMQAGLYSQLGQDQFARGQAQAAGYGNLAQMQAAGLSGAAGLYQGLDAANLARNQFALGGLQGLGQDQFNRQSGLFSGYSSMNQQDLARQQAQLGAYQGLNDEELRRMLGAAGLYGTIGQSYAAQGQYQPSYDLSWLSGLLGSGRTPAPTPTYGGAVWGGTRPSGQPVM